MEPEGKLIKYDKRKGMMKKKRKKEKENDVISLKTLI